MHCFIGSGYTGNRAFDDTPMDLYSYENGWPRPATDQQDFLLWPDAAGQVHEPLALPAVLARDAPTSGGAYSAWRLNGSHSECDGILFLFQMLERQSVRWSPITFRFI